MRFGRIRGWLRIIKGKLCTHRATDVRDLGKVVDPIGERTDAYYAAMFAEAEQVLPAGGRLPSCPSISAVSKLNHQYGRAKRQADHVLRNSTGWPVLAHMMLA